MELNTKFKLLLITLIVSVIWGCKDVPKMFAKANQHLLHKNTNPNYHLTIRPNETVVNQY